MLTDRHTDSQTRMTTRMVAFRNFANAPTIQHFAAQIMVFFYKEPTNSAI
jgi:hypothetical protein